jgi:hypothetical protein
MWWDETKLKLPLFGAIMSMRFYAQFAHSLGNLITNGVPLLNSIRLVSKISANVFIQTCSPRSPAWFRKVRRFPTPCARSAASRCCWRI